MRRRIFVLNRLSNVGSRCRIHCRTSDLVVATIVERRISSLKRLSAIRSRASRAGERRSHVVEYVVSNEIDLDWSDVRSGLSRSIFITAPSSAFRLPALAQSCRKPHIPAQRATRFRSRLGRSVSLRCLLNRSVLERLVQLPFAFDGDTWWGPSNAKSDMLLLR